MSLPTDKHIDSQFRKGEKDEWFQVVSNNVPVPRSQEFSSESFDEIQTELIEIIESVDQINTTSQFLQTADYMGI